MKIHIHLGAHKTATTHFQNVLEANRHLYPAHTEYIGMCEFRRNLAWKNRKVDLQSCGRYLDNITSYAKTLVISEENISGETKDIYKHVYLYSDIETRLASLDRLTQAFDEIEVWFGIRSMDGFLPSIYCESLRHWPYKSFAQVFDHQYKQIWLPVIQSIRLVYPKARINVIRYEHYSKILPSIIKRIFDSNRGWDYLDSDRPRVAMNHYACKLMNTTRFIIPPSMQSRAIQDLALLFDKMGTIHKFSPFNQDQINELMAIYSRDIQAIKKLDNVFVY